MIDEDPTAVIVSQVRDAYGRLMDAFREGNTDAYFGCFHEEASFIFPGEALLEPRSAYRAVWSGWQQEGVRFTDVVADDIRVRVFGETAVVTHHLRTTVAVGEHETVDRERESIVFAHVGDRWLAVHEHLSADET